MLHALTSEAVSTASESIAKNSVLGALLILSIGALVVLWRRDVKRGDDALARESSRADAAEKAKADLEREFRERIVPLLSDTARLNTIAVDALRERRQA